MNCPHGFEKPTQCIDCMEDGPVVEPPTWKRIGAVFSATFAGECPCAKPIELGDWIRRWDLGTERTVYTHQGCRP